MNDNEKYSDNVLKYNKNYQRYWKQNTLNKEISFSVSSIVLYDKTEHKNLYGLR